MCIYGWLWDFNVNFTDTMHHFVNKFNSGSMICQIVMTFLNVGYWYKICGLVLNNFLLINDKLNIPM